MREGLFFFQALTLFVYNACACERESVCFVGSSRARVSSFQSGFGLPQRRRLEIPLASFRRPPLPRLLFASNGEKRERGTLQV